MLPLVQIGNQVEGLAINTQWKYMNTAEMLSPGFFFFLTKLLPTPSMFYAEMLAYSINLDWLLSRRNYHQPDEGSLDSF